MLQPGSKTAARSVRSTQTAQVCRLVIRRGRVARGIWSARPVTAGGHCKWNARLTAGGRCRSRSWIWSLKTVGESIFYDFRGGVAEGRGGAAKGHRVTHSMGRVRGAAVGRRSAGMERWTLSLLGGSDCQPKEKDIEKNRVHSGRHPPAASHMQWGVLRGNTHSVRGTQSCHDGRMRYSKVMTNVGSKRRKQERARKEERATRARAGPRWPSTEGGVCWLVVCAGHMRGMG